MFGFNSDSAQTSNIQLAQVKSRLEGVDYVFFDEVSMLSFGGLNMIFAGNFAQLPPDDITFLRSRVSSELPGHSSVNEKQFRNVSIITTLNSQKDEINQLGSERFAAETKQQLSHFFSIDSVPSKDPEDQWEKKSAGFGSSLPVQTRNSYLPNFPYVLACL